MTLVREEGRVIETLVRVDDREPVTIHAGSIPGPPEIAEEHRLDCEARLVFPVDPERSFVGFARYASAGAELVGSGRPEGAAE